jgi:2'-5' RNA ligase
MRLFIATTFPAEVTGELNARVTALKPKLPAASWVRPESQHLTLAFLGEQEDALVDRLAPELERALQRIPRYEASLNGCGFFPNNRHARVAWVGLESEEKFCEVARVVRGVVSKSGIVLDRADFKPHLTLLRIRDPWPPASADTFSKALGNYRSQPFLVDTVTLYSSRLDPKGAIHTPLRRFALG